MRCTYTNRGIAQLVLKLGATCIWVVNITPQLFYTQARKPGWTPQLVRSPFYPTGFQTPDLPARSLVAIPTELSQLLEYCAV